MRLRGGPGTATLAGDGTTLTLTGVGALEITARQAGNANYVAATQTQTITVAQGTQVISFAGSPAGGPVGTDIELVVAGGASGESVTLAITTGAGLATLSGTTLSPTGAGTVIVTAMQDGNANYAAATAVTHEITVAQGTQTITFVGSPAVATVGTDIELVVTGGASGESVTLAITTGAGLATLSGTTLSPTGAGTVIVTAMQVGNANYEAATAVTHEITVSAIPPTLQTIDFTSSETGVVGTEIPLVATGGPDLDVTFAVTTETLPDGSAAPTGEVATLGGDGTTLTLTGVGMVVITATQAGGTGSDAVLYAPATQTQTITVSQGTQTISFAGSPAGGPVGTDIELVVTGGASGESVTLAITTGAGLATLSGTTLSPTGAGTVIVTAMQAGNGNYEAAPSMTYEITVSQGTQTISFAGSPAGGPVGTDIELVVTGGASGESVTLAITTGAGLATLSGTTLSPTGAGTVIITAMQVGNANYAAAMPVTHEITVSAIPPTLQTIDFTSSETGVVGTEIPLVATGGPDLDVTFAVTTETLPDGSAAPTGEVATLGGDGTTLTLTGVGMVVITATQAGGTGSDAVLYAPATQTQTITVSQGTQTISFAGSPAGGPVGTDIELVVAGGASGESVTLAITTGAGLATLSGTTLSPTGAGTVIVTAMQAGNANYAAATAVTHEITVGQGTQTVAITSGDTGQAGTTTIVLMATVVNASGVATGSAITYEIVSETPSTSEIDVADLPVGSNMLELRNPGMVEIRATATGDANTYAEAMATQMITVTADPVVAQVLTFNSTNMGEVGETITLDATGGASGQAVTFEITTERPAGAVATLDAGVLTLVGIGEVVITAMQAGGISSDGATTYAAATPVTQTITVSQGTQTLTFTSDDTGTVGTDIELMVTASSGFRSVDFAITAQSPTSGAGDVATLSGATLSLIGAGTVTITATQAGDANFAMATQTQTITITPMVVPPAVQTITFTSGDEGTVGTDIELMAMASSGLDVTFAVTNQSPTSGTGEVATLSGATLSLTGAGMVTITATQAGGVGTDGVTYAPATQTQTITIMPMVVVSPTTQTLAFTSPVEGQAGSTITLVATATSTGAVTYAITEVRDADGNVVTNAAADAVATLSGSTLTLLAAGMVTITASQAGGDIGGTIYAAATQTQVITITPVVLGIEEDADDFVLYPNPTSGKLHFSEQVGEFRLYSVEGRVLEIWKNVRSVDLMVRPSGMYFAEVIRDGRSVRYRIMRE